MTAVVKPATCPVWCRNSESACAEDIHLSASRTITTDLVEGMPTGSLGVDVCLVDGEPSIGLSANRSPFGSYSPRQIRQLIAACMDALDAVEQNTPFGGAR